MDLWQLHIFRNVVEHGSFSRAARAVHLSQPTVSSHIKYLEEYFGTRLLDRLGREVTPTPGGRILYDHAKRLLALRDQTENAMAEYQGLIRGTLLVGASTIPGGYVLPPVVGAFAKKHPEVRVTLMIADTRGTTNAVMEGRVEAGIVGAVASDSRLVHEKLTDDIIQLVLHPDNPLARRGKVAWEELVGEPFILREGGSGTRRTVERILSEAGRSIADLKVVAEMGSNEAVREAVRTGIGAALMSIRAVAGDVAAGNLVATGIVGLDFSRSFYLVTHRHRTVSPLCAVFLDFLRKSLS
ncbi:MAG: selenium metabolism-associated LysR family transcriptional regulator [Desulfatibacillaceae bacterium]